MQSLAQSRPARPHIAAPAASSSSSCEAGDARAGKAEIDEKCAEREDEGEGTVAASTAAAAADTDAVPVGIPLKVLVLYPPVAGRGRSPHMGARKPFCVPLLWWVGKAGAGVGEELIATKSDRPGAFLVSGSKCVDRGLCAGPLHVWLPRVLDRSHL